MSPMLGTNCLLSFHYPQKVNAQNNIGLLIKSHKNRLTTRLFMTFIDTDINNSLLPVTVHNRPSVWLVTTITVFYRSLDFPQTPHTNNINKPNYNFPYSATTHHMQQKAPSLTFTTGQ